jgi:predicted DNA-binding ribbon-helix-helix protein
MAESNLEKHSVTIQGHRTSITLEKVFWDTLKKIAHQQNKSIKALIEEIDETRRGNLSSAIRVYVLQHK